MSIDYDEIERPGVARVAEEAEAWLDEYGVGRNRVGDARWIIRHLLAALREAESIEGQRDSLITILRRSNDERDRLLAALREADGKFLYIASITTDCPLAMEEASFYRDQLRHAIGTAALALRRPTPEDPGE